MKKDYIGLWLILVVSLGLFMALSFTDDLNLGGWEMKKATFKDTLLADAQSEKEDSIVNSDSIIAPEPYEPQTDSLPKNIFLFGDSMTLNIALHMSKYAAQNHHTFHSVNWDSSNTKLWAETDTLKYYLKKYKPDYIFISLGSNEMFFKDPSSRKPYIEKILATIDTLPYVWIGPPNWNEDTGINGLIETLCKKGSFFSSTGINLKRKDDNIHPTRHATTIWVDSLMRWLPKSRHPILMETPSDTLGKVKTDVIILKALNS